MRYGCLNGFLFRHCSLRGLLAVAVVTGAGVFAHGAGSDWTENLSFSALAGFESEYVFRGERRAGSSLQPGFEVGVPVGPGDAYAGVWANLGMEGGDPDEVDYYAGYAVPVSRIVALGVGATLYTYPGGGSDRGASAEPFAGFFADLPLRPALFGYFDVEQEQLLAEVSLGGGTPVTESLGFEWTVAGGAAHARKPFGGTGRNGFWFGDASADLVWRFRPGLEASAGMRYAGRLDGGWSEHLFWGCAVEAAF